MCTNQETKNFYNTLYIRQDLKKIASVGERFKEKAEFSSTHWIKLAKDGLLSKVAYGLLIFFKMSNKDLRYLLK